MTATYRDISPLDFPQVWQRPSFEELLACLKQLHIEPQVWGPKSSKTPLLETQEKTARDRREVTSYLASIISNTLHWLHDDDQREAIWDEASRCLSQRCGRAGMGEMTRRWPFEDRQIPFELTVREPPITSDALGHKTWGSSFVMAQLLDGLTSGSLSHLLVPGCRESLKVLELGSGTGLLGIAAAAIWQTEVVLTDLPDILPNLDYNIEQNRATVQRLGGNMSSGVLVWGSESGNEARFSLGNQFDIILVADGVYDDDHPKLLSSAIHEQLCDSPDSRVIVMTPMRDEITRKLIAQFRSSMNTGAAPLLALEEHIITAQDDWGDNDDDESRAIECWWAIFGSQSTCKGKAAV
ncbi:putative methyltransferase-domain-containing protein [Xylaria venustula]|nr:putative methyltransferase-domain-containing protein [Xylaria venustula]